MEEGCVAVGTAAPAVGTAAIAAAADDSLTVVVVATAVVIVLLFSHTCKSIQS